MLYREFSYIKYINQETHLIKHIMISSNIYIFRDRSAISRGSTDISITSPTNRSVGLVICVCRLPENGTPVPKHVEVATYHDLY